MLDDWGSVSGTEIRFFFSTKYAVRTAQPLIPWVMEVLPRCNAAGHEVHNTSLSIAEVKN